MHVARELFVILLLILANGVFAMAETGFLSARKARLQAWADAGDLKARAALELAKSPGRFLSTVQIGITLIGILAGAFGGATLAQELALQLARVPWLEPYSQVVALGIVVFIIGYLSLVLGELVPKRLALNHPEKIAVATAAPMKAVSSIAAPFVHLVSSSTDLVLKTIGAKPADDPPITEEEVAVMMEEGTRAGTFKPAEQKMVSRVFSLSDRRVAGLMTPRTEIVWLDVSDTIAEVRDKIARTPHSQFPVCRGNLDEVIGVVHTKDLFVHGQEGQSFDLSKFVRRPLFVPESMLALRLIELIDASGQKLALVIDEYSGVQGLVTIDDILQTFVVTVTGTDELKAVQRQDGSWLVDGLLPVHEFKEIIRPVRLPDDENAGGYETVGGLVMAHLRKIPSVGDVFEWGGVRFEVVDMDGRRVDQVLVSFTASERRASARVQQSIERRSSEENKWHRVA